MLKYLESEEEVPETELDRMNIRDNLKAAEDAGGGPKSRRRAQFRQLEKFLTHWKSKVEDKVGIKNKKEVNLIIILQLQLFRKWRNGRVVTHPGISISKSRGVSKLDSAFYPSKVNLLGT